MERTTRRAMLGAIGSISADGLMTGQVARATVLAWVSWHSATFNGARATVALPPRRRVIRDADIPVSGFLIADAVALGRGRFDVLLVKEA